MSKRNNVVNNLRDSGNGLQYRNRFGRKVRIHSSTARADDPYEGLLRSKLI